MTQARMMEGTTEEVTRRMQQSYAGQKLRVFIEPEEPEQSGPEQSGPEEVEDLAAGLPDPPFTVRSREHLVGLLHEGINSPAREFTDDTVEQMRREVRQRHAQKRP